MKPKLKLKTFVGHYQGKVYAAITHQSYVDVLRHYHGNFPFKLMAVKVGVIRAA